MNNFCISCLTLISFLSRELVLVTSALPMQLQRAKREETQSFHKANTESNEEVIHLNITVIMLNRRTALLQWWPRNALIHKDIEIVFTPEFSNYKVVIGLVDPVGNTVELHDLKPYTYYQLDLRERHGQSLYASVNFSTAVLDSKLALTYQPTTTAGGFPVTVRPSEIAIVAIVLCVWATAVYVFINQWGKIRGLIPYQPQYKYQEPLDEETLSQCHHYDTQLRQVHTFDELFTINLEREKFRGGHLLKGRLNNSSIYIGPNCIDDGRSDEWWADASQMAIRKTKSAENIVMNPTIVVNSSTDESGEEDERLLMPIDQNSVANVNSMPKRKDLLNPPSNADFYGLSCSRSLSRSSSNGVGLAAVGAPPQKIPVLSLVTGKAAMAGKNAFLQSIRAKRQVSMDGATPASNPPPSSLYTTSGNVPVMIAANPSQLKRYRCSAEVSYPRRQMSSHPPPTSAFADLMENSIPQTTTLFNRMYKKSPSAGGAGTAIVGGTVGAAPKITGTGSGWRPETGKRKACRSTESQESANSSLIYSLEVSEATKQRVGSFRSRLRKQQPISMPEPPTSKNQSRQASDQSSLETNSTPHVAVTVHDVIDPSKEVTDL